MKVEHILSEKHGNDCLFVPKTMNIYEADELFTKRKMNNERLDIIFITETGSPDEDILGLISSSDANVIDQYLIF